MPNSMGGAARGVLVLMTVIFLVIMAILVIGSILAGDDSSGGDDDANERDAVPVEAADLDAGPADMSGVRCGRPADGSDAAFRVDVAADLANEEVIIALELVDVAGERHPRTVTVPVVEAGVARQVIIPDSADLNLYQACVVTVIQLDRKVIITGQ